MAGAELLLDRYNIHGKSAVGDPTRRYEDRIRYGLVQSHLGSLIVGVVADGVGSADFGSNAAQLAVDTIFKKLERSQAATIPEMIDEAIREANDAVNAENARAVGDGQTTLVVTVIHQDRVYIGNVGDSRAYWMQESGKLVQITQDHTYYNKYGGDPNSDEAGSVVNAIGLRETVGIDLGFYMSGEIQDKKRAFSMGLGGLPLKDGDAILLCSDGLIKNNVAGQRFATDAEIVESLQTEFAPAAAVKMVGYAEGRKVDDNVSAVVIQRLSPQRIAQMEHRKAATRRMGLYRRLAVGFAIGVLAIGLGFSAKALMSSQKALAAAQNATAVIIQITNTPMPSPTPTMPIDPGKARIEQVNGSGSASFTGPDGQAGVLTPGGYVDTGTVLTAGDGSVGVLVGGDRGINSTMVLFATSTARLNFGEKVMVDLTGGAAYVAPGEGGALVNLTNFGEVAARLLDSGGRMVVQILNETEVAVLCFRGPCEVRVPNGGDLSWGTVKDGEKRVFDLVSSTLRPGELIIYDEQWQINLGCNYCMSDLVSTPTPKPVIYQWVENTPELHQEDDADDVRITVVATTAPPTIAPTVPINRTPSSIPITPTATKGKRPTPTESPSIPAPTDIPPTQVTTDVPTEDPKPTDVPTEDPKPTDVPTEDPVPSDTPKHK